MLHTLHLEHYGSEHLAGVRDASQAFHEPGARRSEYDKPRGLWVSVKGEDDWPSWCLSEMPHWMTSRARTKITLAADANVLLLTGEGDIDRLTVQYGKPADRGAFITHYIAWEAVAEDHDGIIIAPYVWSRRLHMPTNWYYTWDCASGCIWNARAVSALTPDGYTSGSAEGVAA